MHLLQATFLLCSLLLLVPSNQVAAAGIDLVKASTCVEIVIEGGSFAAVRVIPLVKELASCAKFSPKKTNDLDPQALFQLLNDFLREMIGHQTCILDALTKTQGWIQPYVTKLTNAKCMS